MSAAAVPGRTIPNLLADIYGQFNALSLMSLASGALIFAMFGIKDTAGVIVFALLYGFCSGACEFLHAILIPIILIPHSCQFGSANHGGFSKRCLRDRVRMMYSLTVPLPLTPVLSVRMGLGFFIVGFANLTGTPIVGALLKHDYPWWKAIVFSGVSVLL